MDDRVRTKELSSHQDSLGEMRTIQRFAACDAAWRMAGPHSLSQLPGQHRVTTTTSQVKSRRMWP